MITEREKKLMLAASENMFWFLVCKLEIEVPSVEIKQELDNWLDSPIADNGATVAEYLNSQ